MEYPVWNGGKPLGVLPLLLDRLKRELEELKGTGGGWDLFLILLETASMDCSYEGTCSLYLERPVSSQVPREADLAGFLY